MIDYEEELKKFEPCLDVTDAEEAIYDRELTDILDILQEMLREEHILRMSQLSEILNELYELRRVPGR